VSKHWTNSLDGSFADTVEQEIWLDEYDVLDDGSERWSCKEKNYTKS
jgi:hypothetical protein